MTERHSLDNATGAGKSSIPIAFGAYDVFCAAKAGNLEALQYFIEERGVEVNSRYHDATPLYYASLCGHYHCVQYLLGKGANCAENTYDGDRCLYGALTLEIKNLLLDYATRKTPISVFAQQLGSSRCSSVVPPNARFVLVDKEFLYHSSILALRLRGLKRVLAGLESTLPTLHPEALDAFISYCYRDVVEIPYRLFEEFRKVCEAFGQPNLYSNTVKERAREKKRRQRCLIVSPLRREGFTLASDLRRGFLAANRMENPIRDRTDVVLSCQDSQVFRDKNEANEIVFNQFKPNIVGLLLEYLYSNKPDFGYLSENFAEEVLELLDATTMLLLRELQTAVCNHIIDSKLVNLDNVYDWLDVADIYDAGTLRNHCTSVLGEYFMQLPVDKQSLTVATSDLLSLRTKEKRVARFAAYLQDASKRKDRTYQLVEIPQETTEPYLARQEKLWHKATDEGESCADFLIGEVREAMIENMLCNDISMFRRGVITDSFEEACNVWVQHELAAERGACNEVGER